MTGINDFHLFRGGYVIVTPMGISRCPLVDALRERMAKFGLSR